MEQILWPFLIGMILFVFIGVAVKMPGRLLQQKFVSLNPLKDKTKQEIISVVGQPTSQSGLPDGKTLLQWQATGYHIALRFNGDICEGVTHQHAAR